MQSTRPTYQQVYGMVMQLSPDDRLRLRESLWNDENKELKPYTVEEIHEMVREAETDIAAGRCCTAEEGWKKLEEEFPWLKD